MRICFHSYIEDVREYAREGSCEAKVTYKCVKCGKLKLKAEFMHEYNTPEIIGIKGSRVLYEHRCKRCRNLEVFTK